MVCRFYEPISVPEVILGDQEVRVENQPGCHTGSIVPAEYIILYTVYRAGIFKPLWSPGIDAKASTPPAYVAWRAGAITLFLVGA
jgi:hypothetical protein